MSHFSLVAVFGTCLAIASFSLAAEPAQHVVGRWDDGRVGENIQIELNEDGTGRVISLAVEPLKWQLNDKKTLVEIVQIRQEGGANVRWALAFDASQQLLRTDHFYGKDVEHTFRRVNPAR